MDYFKFIEPLNKRVEEIQESLYYKELLVAGEEQMIYGTFEISYKKFYTENLRNGISVNEINYFNERIKELNIIEQGVVSLEEKLENIKFHAILSKIFDIKEIANKLINEFNLVTIPQDKSKPKRLKNKLTYKWLLPHQEINSLYLILKKENIISKNTKYLDFEFIFKEKNITEISKPVVWTSSNATEILFFILQLIENNIIDGKNRMDYILLKECFVNAENEKFKENFKILKTNINVALSANKQSVILSIIEKMNK